MFSGIIFILVYASSDPADLTFVPKPPHGTGDQRLSSFRSSQQQTERLENCALPASVIAQERHPQTTVAAATKTKGCRWKAAYILNRKLFHPHIFPSARKIVGKGRAWNPLRS
jgi:hypothetical protein